MRRRRAVVASVAAALLVGSCGILEPDEDRLVLYVAAQRVPCVGVGPMECMLVRQDTAADWEFFYDGILGFTHESGYEYTLYVARREVRNPPADGSTLAYRLLRILEKKRAE
jgi:hypothetical protein